jgi:WD40 repeat protein
MLRDLEQNKVRDGSAESASPHANYQLFRKFRFSEDGRLCAETGLTGDMAIWGMEGAERVLRCVISRHRPESFGDQDLCAFSADGTKIAAFDNTDLLKIWDTLSGKTIGQMTVSSRPELFAFAPDNQLWLVHLAKEIRTWRPGEDQSQLLTKLSSTEELEQTRSSWWMANQLEIADSIQLTADRAQLVFISRADHDEQHTVHIWNTADGSLVSHRLPFQGTGWPRIGLSGDGTRIAVQGTWAEAQLTNLQTGEEYTSFRVPEAGRNQSAALSKLYQTVRFSSDGTLAAWNEAPDRGGVVRVYDVTTGVTVKKVEVDFPVTCLALARSARGLALADEKRIFVHDESSESPRILENEAAVTAMAYSADATLLVSASAYDGVVNLWRPASGERLMKFHTEWNGVCEVKLSPSGRWLAAMDHRGRVRLWDLADVLARLQEHRLGW